MMRAAFLACTVWILTTAIATMSATAGPQQHEPLTDPIAPDSPNAVGRYLWAVGQFERDELHAAGWIDTDQLVVWRRYDWDEEDRDDAGMPDVFAWRDRLAEMQPVTDAIVNASRMDVYRRGMSLDPMAPRFPEGDPRRSLFGDHRLLTQLLMDDAVRLWVSGDRSESIERAEAIVRMGLQIAGDRGRLMDKLLASAVMGLGLKLVTTMHEHDSDREHTEQLRAIVGLIPPWDGVGVIESWKRQYREQAMFIGRELEGDEAGLALWIELGKGAGVLIVLDEFVSTALKEGSADIGGAIDQAAVMEEITEVVGDLTTEDLKRSFARGQAIGDRLCAVWTGSGSAEEREAIELAVAYYEDDETYIAAMLGMVIGRLDETVRRLDDKRADAALRLGMEPAPDASPAP